MADFYSSPVAGAHRVDKTHGETGMTRSKSLAKLTNGAGALVSVALVVGIGVWGYKLLARDVSGIPVVRAAEGEMRVRPEEPGGQLARHQGLSVNVVAANGIAGKPADRLILAPKPLELAEEDQPIKVAMVAPEPQVAPVTDAQVIAVAAGVPDVAAALRSGAVDELVASLTDGIAPLDAEAEESADAVATVTEEIVQEVETAKAVVAKAVLDAPGVSNSLRPRNRPRQAAQAMVVKASLSAEDAAVTAAVDAVTRQLSAGVTREVPADSVPKGTRLVQLGAFDSPEIAREQWNKLNRRFEVYLGGKDRVVQKATSGGRVFYRLRAMGFEDIADARRFCSALVSEKADCIPVVTR